MNTVLIDEGLQSLRPANAINERDPNRGKVTLVRVGVVNIQTH
jgi:hypothetical protein